MKADDAYTIPLCASDHAAFDQNLRQQTRQQQLDWFNERLESTNKTLRRVNDAAIQNHSESF